MGVCCSSSSYKHMNTSVAMAQLILEDGRLQEYPYPVKVSYILQKNPSCFICNSDEMGYDAVLSAVRGGEELQLGQLYFVLPLSRLKRHLRAEDMAALAVKATLALAGTFIVFSAMKPSENVRSRDRKAERRGNFRSRLTAIPE